MLLGLGVGWVMRIGELAISNFLPLNRPGGFQTQAAVAVRLLMLLARVKKNK